MFLFIGFISGRYFFPDNSKKGGLIKFEENLLNRAGNTNNS
jgi:hypothetical protein